VHGLLIGRLNFCTNMALYRCLPSNIGWPSIRGGKGNERITWTTIWIIFILFRFILTSNWTVSIRGPNRPKKIGLACPWQAIEVFSLPVPVTSFPRPGLPACDFHRPAWPGLSQPVCDFIYWYYMINQWNLRKPLQMIRKSFKSNWDG